jgi:hypothetical protein
MFKNVELNMRKRLKEQEERRMLMNKRVVSNVLLVIYVSFFSLPMFFIWWSPIWQVMSIYDPFAIINRCLALLSPWALLTMIIVCYKKGLRLQTYVITLLFFYAILTESLIIFYIQLLQTPRYYFPRWP